MSDIFGAFIHLSNVATAFALPFAVMASCALEAAGTEAVRRRAARLEAKDSPPTTRHAVPQCKADRPD